jgi:hypothetical protein
MPTNTSLELLRPSKSLAIPASPLPDPDIAAAAIARPELD